MRDRQYKCLINGAVKARLDETLRQRRSTLTAYTESLAVWFCELEPLMQNLLLQQVTPADRADIAKLLLRRMSKPRRRK